MNCHFSMKRPVRCQVLPSRKSAFIRIAAVCRKCRNILMPIIGKRSASNQLADMVGMTPVSFSRFFKLRTGKNLSDYIIDIRLGFAARLLVDSTMSIAEICYECGFNNLSNFNRIFKKKKECSPKEFRENYRKKKKLV